MTQTRQQEVALSKYLGYTVEKDMDAPFMYSYWRLLLNGEPKVECKLYQCYDEETAWKEMRPKFSTDESLLSPLMKGLAEKGCRVSFDGDFQSCEWKLRAPGKEENILWDSKILYGSTRECQPIRALFEVAIQLPEVQQLLTQTTEQHTL